MPLNLKDLDPTGSGSQGSSAVGTYITTDNAAVVEADGYFDAAATALRNNQFLLANMGDANKIYTVAVVGTDVTLSTGTAIA